MEKRFISSVALPSITELIDASALLCARPDLAARSSAEEIAVIEYGYYSTQTYLFEVVGFQLLGEMAAGLRRFDFVHELAEQARDEAEHARLYRDVVASLGEGVLGGALDVHAAPVYDAFVAKGSLEEKVVTSFLVLEGLAVGIFAARQRFYRTSPLAEIDRRILTEEAQHQEMGVRLVAELIRDGRLTLDDVSEIMRQAAGSVGRLLVPTPLFERFGVGDSVEEQERIASSGFLAMQRATTHKSMLNAVRRLRRSLATTDGDMPHARAA